MPSPHSRSHQSRDSSESPAGSPRTKPQGGGKSRDTDGGGGGGGDNGPSDDKLVQPAARSPLSSSLASGSMSAGEASLPL
jgi:hypothetical protein